jgi:DNA-binding beta-propeller fold protein YncE
MKFQGTVKVINRKTRQNVAEYTVMQEADSYIESGILAYEGASFVYNTNEYEIDVLMLEPIDDDYKM